MAQLYDRGRYAEHAWCRTIKWPLRILAWRDGKPLIAPVVPDEAAVPAEGQLERSYP